MLNSLRKRLARAIAPPRAPKQIAAPDDAKGPAKRAGKRQAAAAAGMPGRLTRMYASARASRLTTGWGTSTTSANYELYSSLTNLRNRSRALVRDSAYAKRAKLIVVNNVVGSGIGMQAEVRSTRDELREDVNNAIESAWEAWSAADNCHTGGAMHFSDLERTLIGQVFEAGEVFVRIHRRAFGRSQIPFALELVEPERLADEYMNPGPTAPGFRVVMGVEVDGFHRPVAYWIRTVHPGDIRVTIAEISRLERVPAEDIIHLRIVDRWPQTRGEPWLHAVMRKLNDIDGYTEAEIVAARGAANYMATIETVEELESLGEAQTDGTFQTELEPGIVEKLAPGEKLNFISPNRPNSALDPFLRYMLREMAAGTGCSYESLSRDYSQSNYSSSRLALLDDRDGWKSLQRWFLRGFRDVVHRQWLLAAVLANQIAPISRPAYAAEPSKFEAVSFKPRGWSWIDPTKEVEAYKEAVRCGFTTLSDVIAQTAGGVDLEDVLKQRRREVDQAEQLDIQFSTSPEVYVPELTRGRFENAGATVDPVVGTAGVPAEAAPPAKPAAAAAPPARLVSLRR